MISWTQHQSQVKSEPSDPLYVQAINSTKLEMRVANINRERTIFSVNKSNDSISVVVCPAIYRRVVSDINDRLKRFSGLLSTGN